VLGYNKLARIYVGSQEIDVPVKKPHPPPVSGLDLYYTDRVRRGGKFPPLLA